MPEYWECVMYDVCPSCGADTEGIDSVTCDDCRKKVRKLKYPVVNKSKFEKRNYRSLKYLRTVYYIGGFC